MPDASGEFVTTWAQVLPRDVIRGADGREWLVASIGGGEFVMIDFNDRVVTGKPRGDSAVTVLKPAPLREILAVFREAGIILTFIEETETDDNE
jgi:hypothetical protein